MRPVTYALPCLTCPELSPEALTALDAARVAAVLGWRRAGSAWRCPACLACEERRSELGVALRRRVAPWHPSGSTLDWRAA
jgi:hypothetical protein